MLLTITYTGRDTTDLGYLLYKNPYRPQTFELNHGKAYVFYPEVSDERTTAALLLDIDPIGLVRSRPGAAGVRLFDYVNDRPYVSSSFMSTAISRVYGTAMTGRADSRQALSDSPLDLTATVTMLPCSGEQQKLYDVFQPLGYEVRYESFVSDECFPDWGESRYVNLTIRGNVRLRDLLKHLYVLIPVFDRQKHYWIGADEVEKLLRIGEGWLSDHPEKAYITGRYLSRRRSLVNMAFARLAAANEADGESSVAETEGADRADRQEEKLDKKLNLNEQRLESVVAELKSCGARRVVDVGCGEGRLMARLVRESQFTAITGMDVSHVALEHARDRLHLDRAGETLRERVQLFHGSLMYRDDRLSGFDAACVVEVIEHLDAPRLSAFARVLFVFAKPHVVILTTPNKEYNAVYGLTEEDDLRHGDHRFEWTREEFRDWATKTAKRFGYTVQFSGIGPSDSAHGAPTQMGVFVIDR